MSSLIIRSLEFSYDSSDKNILSNLSASFARGWTGLVGANGCGKSTLLKILAGQLHPTHGSVQGPSRRYYCAQETLLAPKELDAFIEAYDQNAIHMKNSLGLHELLTHSWNQLSSGEQKRLQLACALWNDPEILLVDEPTNHLDRESRDFVMQALRLYNGIGIIVSHDRELLQNLCTHTLFFLGKKIYDFSAPLVEARRQLDQILASQENAKLEAKKKSRALEQELSRLQEIEQGSKNRISKKHVRSGDSDTRAKINLARLTGKDASLGQKKQNLQNRIHGLDQRIESYDVIKDYSGTIDFDLPEVNASKVILHKDECEIPLPSGSRLSTPELVICASEKVGIVGKNGAGKSSLLQTIVQSGWLRTTRFFYLKQELDPDELQRLQILLKELSPDLYARCLQIVARLGSDAKQILSSKAWSAGEARKVAIALAIVNKVDLLILDEPTNHLDLPTIEKLENALAQSSLTLLIVSHDSNFLQNVCTRTWAIENNRLNMIDF